MNRAIFTLLFVSSCLAVSQATSAGFYEHPIFKYYYPYNRHVLSEADWGHVDDSDISAAEQSINKQPSWLSSLFPTQNQPIIQSLLANFFSGVSPIEQSLNQSIPASNISQSGQFKNQSVLVSSFFISSILPVRKPSNQSVLLSAIVPAVANISNSSIVDEIVVNVSNVSSSANTSDCLAIRFIGSKINKIHFKYKL
jgi:hypothetical protein